MVGDKGEAGKKVSYGKLIGDKQFHLTVDKKAPQKDPKAYTIVGKAIPRPDIPAKMAGTFTYMQDFRVDGMLHGRVGRSEERRGGKEGGSRCRCRWWPDHEKKKQEK